MWLQNTDAHKFVKYTPRTGNVETRKKIKNSLRPLNSILFETYVFAELGNYLGLPVDTTKRVNLTRFTLKQLMYTHIIFMSS